MASVKDLTRFGVDLSNARHIAVEDFNLLVKQGCQPLVGDVLIAKDGNSALDTVCEVKKPLDAVLLSSVAILRPDPSKLSPAYLKHYLSSPDVIAYLKSNFISGAAIPRVVLKDFKRALVRVPPPADQARVAAVLDALDDRIDLLRQTNVTLESIAQTLFKSWFIDFDPLRAKAEGREPEGMDAATAALFPAEFEESALGLIPKGWRAGTVEDLLVLQRGFDLPASQRTEGPFRVLAASGPSGTHHEAMVQGPGVTTGRSGIIGNVFFAQESFWPLNTSLWVKVFKVATPAYAYQFLKTLDLKRLNAGSAVPTLNRNHVHAQPAVLPSAPTVQAYSALASALLERRRRNDEQADTLADLRDTLLPRLISGKFRLPEAQAELEEAMA